jgi:nicotinate phosphoribosyltransferase
MGTHEYDQPMFKIDYINFLKKLRLPDFRLGQPVDGQINLRFSGVWSEATNWEIMSMYIVNELYYRALTKGYSRFECERVEAEGRIRLADKIKMLRQNPQIRFSDFGTRRRFSREWQDYVVGGCRRVPPIDGEPGQFLGTSNVHLAQKYGLMPMGTNAHELPMVYSGIYKDEDEEDPTFSSKMVIEDWESEYNKGLLLFLPDTFGSDWFFKNVVTPKRLASWRGSRQDSGIPIEYAEKRIKEYKALTSIRQAHRLCRRSDCSKDGSIQGD